MRGDFSEVATDVPLSFVPNLTERPERLESLLAAALQYALRGSTNEVHPALLHLLLLRPNADSTLAFSANDDARSLDGLERDLGARRVEVCLDDGELFDGRVIEHCGGVR